MYQERKSMETSRSKPLALADRMLPAVLLFTFTAHLVACLYFYEYAGDTGTKSYQMLDQVFDEHPDLGRTASIVIGATIVMLLAALIGISTWLLAPLKQAAPTGRGNRRLILGGVCALGVFLVLLLRVPDLRLPSGPHGTLEILALLTASLLFALVLLRAEGSSQLLRLVLFSSGAAALAMSVSVMALLHWLTAFSLAAPSFFNGQVGAFGLTTAATLLAILVVMASATGGALTTVVLGFFRP
jgi:hypothetical protein